MKFLPQFYLLLLIFNLTLSWVIYSFRLDSSYRFTVIWIPIDLAKKKWMNPSTTRAASSNQINARILPTPSIADSSGASLELRFLWNWGLWPPFHNIIELYCCVCDRLCDCKYRCPLGLTECHLSASVLAYWFKY